LLVSGFVCGFQLAFITVHLPPYLAEHTASARNSRASPWAPLVFFNVWAPHIGDHWRQIPEENFESHLCPAFNLRCRLHPAAITATTTIIFTATMGFLWLSTVPLTMGLVTVMFGTRYMATLYGVVFLSHQIGSFFGVWLGGRLYDQFGSYDPVWWMGVALGLFAAIVHLPIKEMRAPTRRGLPCAGPVTASPSAYFSGY
jgi:hypothetical protein